jgi:hypothetical protein
MWRLVVAFVVLALALGSGGSLAAEQRPASGTFSPAGSLAEARNGHTATLLPDGRILVIGGGDGNAYLGSAEVWDPLDETFGPTGSPLEARGGHTATLLPDGRILVVGGGGGDYGDNDFLASAELWDPAGSTFAGTGSLARSRVGHTATLLEDGGVLVVGGYDVDGGPVVRAAAELWDSATGTFTRAGKLAQARYGHTATLLPDGRVLVIGGIASSGSGFEMLATTELWDPSTGAFRPGPPLVEPHAVHTATLLPDGGILVVGGLRSGPDFASAELWDPATETFRPTGALTELRMNHTATLLPDGRVLVIGGSGGSDLLTSAELWDPTTGTFGPAGSLAAGRDFHTATLLPDGRVLVVGGGVRDAEAWGDATPPTPLPTAAAAVPSAVPSFALSGTPPSSGSPAPSIGPDEFVAAVCTAVDELFTAVGNPDTGDMSDLGRSFEAAIVAGDLPAVDAAAAAMLEHLDAARAATERAGGFGPAAAAMDRFLAFLAFAVAGVEAGRDAAPEGLDSARAAAQRAWEGAYEPWVAWMQEMRPVWSTYGHELPVPCPTRSPEPVG